MAGASGAAVCRGRDASAHYREHSLVWHPHMLISHLMNTMTLFNPLLRAQISESSQYNEWFI